MSQLPALIWQSHVYLFAVTYLCLPGSYLFSCREESPSPVVTCETAEMTRAACGEGQSTLSLPRGVSDLPLTLVAECGKGLCPGSEQGDVLAWCCDLICSPDFHLSVFPCRIHSSPGSSFKQSSRLDSSGPMLFFLLTR